MRILHLNYDDVGNPWVGGGGAMRTHEIYARLAARGHDCTVLTGSYPGAEDRVVDNVRYRIAGKATTHLGSAIAYLLGAQVFLLRRASQWDVIIEDFSLFSPLLVPALSRTPSLVQMQLYASDDLLGRFGPLTPLLRLSQRFYPRLYSHALFLTPTLAQRWPQGHQRRYFVSMGIPEHYLEHPTETGDYLLYLGRLSGKSKGLDVLSEACRQLWKHRNDIRLVIAGRGPDESAVKDLFADLSARYPGRLEFVGFVAGKQKAHLLANCRALVLPSREEGEGLCVIEAAAFGKPTLASDIPELAYVATEGIGLDTSTGDFKSLAQGAEQLFDDAEGYAALSARARIWASDRTWEKKATEFEEVLEDVRRTSRRPLVRRHSVTAK